MSPAKTAEPIKMPFGLRTRVNPVRKDVLGGVHTCRDAHLHNLANAIEPSMCGSDAAFCQITLTTCYYYYYYYY